MGNHKGEYYNRVSFDNDDDDDTGSICINYKSLHFKFFFYSDERLTNDFLTVYIRECLVL